jgi:hypothetical protein
MNADEAYEIAYAVRDLIESTIAGSQDRRDKLDRLVRALVVVSTPGED